MNVEEKDGTCKFIRSHGPANNFQWPRTDDMGYVPLNKFIMTVETPHCSSNGRQFFIIEQELKHANRVFENLKYFPNYMKIHIIF